jgi:GLPGLI family protein
MRTFLTFIFFSVFFLSNMANAQANRFFYEYKFIPNKDSLNKYDTTMTILDITSNKSIYRDYLSVSQDSIIESAIEKMKKTGIQADLSKMFKNPKFMYKVQKLYPAYEVEYTDLILSDFISYKEKISFNWKILNEKEQIGEYKTQKAVCDFGGRKWTAWFSSEIPFQDGPYKFHGLPGLIVKLQDSDGQFVWELKGNKKMDNTYNELSLNERMKNKTPLIVSKQKFTALFNDFKENPLAKVRAKYTAQQLSEKDPQGETLSQKLDKQEKMIKKMIQSDNNNSIEK